MKLFGTRARLGLLVAGVAAASWLSLGCLHRPRREMSQAEADLRAAQKVQAELYAPASFEEARRALADAGRRVKRRKYEEARLRALECSALSKSAASISSENREKMFAAVGLQIEGIAQKIAQGEKEVQAAEQKPVGPRESEMFRTDLAAAREKLDIARESLRQGNLVAARAQAEDADVAAESLLREVRLTVAEEPILHPRSRKKGHKMPA